jgi:hypothetical protein
MRPWARVGFGPLIVPLIHLSPFSRPRHPTVQVPALPLSRPNISPLCTPSLSAPREYLTLPRHETHHHPASSQTFQPRARLFEHPSLGSLFPGPTFRLCKTRAFATPARGIPAEALEGRNNVYGSEI